MSAVRTTIAVLLGSAVLAAPAVAVPPTVAITPGPAAWQTGNPSYAFAATDDATPAVTCELTQPDTSIITTLSCATPWSAVGLTQEGQYTLTVTDDNGVDPPVSDAVSFYVDLTDPSGSFITGPANNHLYGTDPGTVGYSFSISDPNGAPPLASTCALQRPSAVVDGPAACTNSASYATSGDGTYTFSVVSTDGSGRVGTLTRSFTIDTTAPTFLTGPTMSPENTSGWTNSTTPSFAWTTNETATYTCTVDGVSQGACSSGFTTGVLSAGAHSFQVIATDTAGNIANSTLKSFTVDVTAPTFSFGALSQSGSSNFATKLTSTSLAVTPSETLDAAGGSCDIGAGPVACVPTFSAAGPLAAGEHTLNVSGADRAGNAGTGQRKFFVDLVDPDAPTIPTKPPAATNDNTPTFGFSATDPGLSSTPDYGSLTYECKIEDSGGPSAAFGSCATSTTFPAMLDGDYDFVVRATDPSARTGSPTTYSFTIDTVAPVITISSMTPGGVDGTISSSATPTFAFSADEPATFQCSTDGVTYGACTTVAAASGTYQVPARVEGAHTVYVRATDPATNASTRTRAYTVDLTDPVASPSVPDGSELVLHESRAVTCTDPVSNGYASGIDTCVTRVDGGPPLANQSLPTHASDLGDHRYTATATDRSLRTDDAHAAPAEAHYVVNAGEYKDLVNGFGPLGYWRLNNSLGASTMSDASGNNRTGAYKNGVALPRTGPAVDTASNPGAGAAEFSGNNAYGYVNEIIAPQTGYTMDVWARPASAQAMSILGHGAGAGELYVDGSGRFAFRNAGVTITDATTVVNPGDWYHLQATWSRPLADQPGTMTLRVARLNPSSLATVSQNTTTGSSSANPSGKATFYVGYGEQAGPQAFRGLLADAAYFGSALGSHAFDDLTEAMRWTRLPIRAGANYQPPTVTITNPVAGDSYQSFKAPASGTYAFGCTDPDGPPTCVGEIRKDGGAWSSVNNGDPLPATGAGAYDFRVTSDDGAGDPRSKTVSFTIGTYSSVINADSPTAYWRLDEATGATALGDQTGAFNGTFKWDLSDPLSLVNGGAGISGDANTTREWLGRGGYAFVNGLAAPPYASTVEAWVKLDNVGRDQIILQHGGASTLYVAGGTFVYRPNGSVPVAVSGGSPSTSDYRQVVGTWDGVTARLYVDGVIVGSVEAASPPPSGVSTFYLGRGDLNGLPGLHGKLDEVAYFPTALSDRRVLLHYKADPPPAGAESSALAARPGGDSSAVSPAKAKAKARMKIKAAQRALAKARAKLRALRKRQASRQAIAKAQKTVRSRTRALNRARRAAARAYS